MKSFIYSSFLLLFFFGCNPRINTSVTRISNNNYSPKDANCDIKVLSQMPMDRKYEELALLSSVTDDDSFTKKDLDSIIPGLKAKACSLGADAIVIKNIDQGGTPKMEIGGQTPTKVFCVAIRFI